MSPTHPTHLRLTALALIHARTHRPTSYQYHLKPFDEVNQGHTNMGKWGSWSVPHTKMSYSNGQSCWQGPARSCEVTLVCGEKEEILEVKEPNKCEYSMKFATPAACREADVERLERQLKASESDDE